MIKYYIINILFTVVQQPRYYENIVQNAGKRKEQSELTQLTAKSLRPKTLDE